MIYCTHKRRFFTIYLSSLCFVANAKNSFVEVLFLSYRWFSKPFCPSLLAVFSADVPIYLFLTLSWFLFRCVVSHSDRSFLQYYFRSFTLHFMSRFISFFHPIFPIFDSISSQCFRSFPDPLDPSILSLSLIIFLNLTSVVLTHLFAIILRSLKSTSFWTGFCSRQFRSILQFPLSAQISLLLLSSFRLISCEPMFPFCLFGLSFPLSFRWPLSWMQEFISFSELECVSALWFFTYLFITSLKFLSDSFMISLTPGLLSRSLFDFIHHIHNHLRFDD